MRNAWAPIAALGIIAVLQNIDIIAAKHRFSTDLASSYSATAVAAKVLIWVAMGAGFYLVPEVSRRHAAGEETRPVLGKALAIVGVAAIPCLLIFAVASRLLIKLAFGSDRLLAVDALFILGVAFTVLAGTYLAVQYMLALKRSWFLLPLGAVAVAEPILLLNASRPAEAVRAGRAGHSDRRGAGCLRAGAASGQAGEAPDAPQEELAEPELVGAPGAS